jgi:YHS domain-containing protein
MKSILILLPLLFFSSFYGQTASSAEKTRITHFNTDKLHLALQGYDPVSYFTGKPQKGVPAFSCTYTGIVYRFSSKKNMELFLKSPVTFEPMYGGWCAYAMGASGEKVEVDPETYKIIDGKLFLFYNAYFNNTLAKWNKNEVYLNKNANENWKTIYK